MKAHNICFPGPEKYGKKKKNRDTSQLSRAVSVFDIFAKFTAVAAA